MDNAGKYIPPVICHPGDILGEKLEELNMAIKEFAVRSRKPEKDIHKILNGKGRITPDMAVQFEKALGIPANFWLNAQLNYDEFKARKKEELVIEKAVKWMKQFPAGDMVKRGWLPKNLKTAPEKTDALLKFFGFASHEGWVKYYEGQKLATAFRLSLVKLPSPYALSAWLRHGEIEVGKTRLHADFDENELKESLEEMKELAFKAPPYFLKDLTDICSKAGVALICTPHLAKSKVSGATRWIGGRPLVQMSDRLKRYDIFWFSFFHEIAHILLHGKKDIFIEGFDYPDKDEKKEKEADKYASDILIPEKLEKELYGIGQAELNILQFAKENKIHPAIVVGRMRHLEIVPQSFGQRLIPHMSF